LTVVRVHEDEPFEIALKRFKHKCVKAGIFTEVRRDAIMKNLVLGKGERSCLQEDKQ